MRLFITGGTGFVGGNILRVARARYDATVFTTVNSWRSSAPTDFDYAPIDITDREAVHSAIRTFRPDLIVHSAVLTDFPLMYRDRLRAWRTYVDATRHLTDAANDLGSKIILVSTDWVFDGTQHGADEGTPPNPVNYYGVMKVACERVIAERAHNGAVARVAGVSGRHWYRPDELQLQGAGFGHFVPAVAAGLRHSGRFDVWSGPQINSRGTPSLASESAEQILRIALNDLRGTFHCVGGESIERPAFAMLVAELFGFPQSSIHVVPPPEDPEQAGIRYPYDTSLSAQWTAQQLGRPLLNARQIVESYKRQLLDGLL
jgi:dTDP-4-dehydrorhamnose reductase